ncbi:MAG: AAA family ATPase, partial [Candidatus Obscuribacterales bacterium]|nr:AAA family ATPase [Candidatus Obscuribacterales bacterium]
RQLLSANSITGMRINAFRRLQNVHLEDLGQFNIFVGPNNSGKTTVLEAVSLLARPLDQVQWLRCARGRDSVNSRAPIVESIKWMFPHHGDLVSEIHIECEGDLPTRELFCGFIPITAVSDERDEDDVPYDEADPITMARGALLHVHAIVYENSNSNVIQRSLFEGDHNDPRRKSLDEEFEFFEGKAIIQNTSKRKYDSIFVPAKTVFPHTHRMASSQSSQYAEAMDAGAGYLDSAIELLREFDPDIEDVRVVPRGRFVTSTYLKHKKLGYAPLQIFGDGLRKIVQIAFTIPLCRNGILLIDEIETSLHAQRFMRWFRWILHSCRKYDVQLFATTHSLEALDAMLSVQEADHDFVAFRLEEFEGQIEVSRFDFEMLNSLRNELGTEIRW